MRRGEMGPVMYIVLAVVVLLAVVILVMKFGRTSFGIVDFIRGKLP